MKRLIFLLFLSPYILFAQCDSTNLVDYPDVDAQFPGGAVEMKKFIQENIGYPEIERCSLGQFTGRIFLQFIVCHDGEIRNVKLLRPSNSKYDRISIELIEKMPNWIPAEIDDLPVASKVRLPITICLQ